MKRITPLVLILSLLGTLAFASLSGCERSIPEEPTPTLRVVMSPQPPPAEAGTGPTTISVLAPETPGTPTPTIVWDLPTFTPTPIPPLAAVSTPTQQPASPTQPPPTPTHTPLPPSTGGTITYKVEWGDTLYSLAARFGTTVDAIVAANNLLNADFIRVGQTLTIPQGQSGTGYASPTSEIVYVVDPGDTLYAIALRYNTTVDAIAQANGIVNPAFIRPGQRLRIPVAGSGAAPARGGGIHVVQPGETLTAIAARYGTTVWAIAVANNLPNANWIRAGQTLIIPAP